MCNTQSWDLFMSYGRYFMYGSTQVCPHLLDANSQRARYAEVFRKDWPLNFNTHSWYHLPVTCVPSTWLMQLPNTATWFLIRKWISSSLLPILKVPHKSVFLSTITPSTENMWMHVESNANESVSWCSWTTAWVTRVTWTKHSCRWLQVPLGTLNVDNCISLVI